jgi:hypothetical protein
MKVPVGPSSIAGWLTFAGAEIGFALVAIRGSQAELHGPGKWLAVGGLVSLVLTNAGRQLQAATTPSQEALPPPPAAAVAPPVKSE